MGKIRRKISLWLSRPKRKYMKRCILHFTPQTNRIQRPRTPSTVKYSGTPSTNRLSTKRLLTPVSQTKARKRLNLNSGSSKKRLDLELNDSNHEQGSEDFDFEPLTEDETPAGAEEFIALANDKDVINMLSGVGILFYFTQFFRLVKQRKYPLNNIALFLWIETVKWYSFSCAQSMWYFDTTMRFWRAGYRLFHGKFLSFMSGPKCIGKLLVSNRKFGSVNPSDSEINFAVPNANTLITSDHENPTTIKPGIIPQTMSAVKKQKHTNVFMMCADGKKVTAGLDKDFGDVDMFGFESKPTVQENKIRLDGELQTVEDAKEALMCCSGETESQTTHQRRATGMIRTILYLLTVRISEARNLKERQDFGLEKLKERAGKEWKSSKYQYAISGIQAFLYRLQQYIDVSLQNISDLCRLGAELNNGLKYFATSPTLNPSLQGNMRLLKPTDKQVQPIPTWLIKQRSPEWSTIRSMALVTGSTLHNALGLRSLKEQKEHYDKTFLNKPVEFSDLTKQRMEHGTKNEPNALATLVGRFMPFFYPELVYVEEGCYLLNGICNNLIEVSPDGSLKSYDQINTGDRSCIAAVEIKCPFPKEKKCTLMYTVPQYYVCQCLSEMAALNTNCLIFVCYTKKSSTLFNMEFDSNLWHAMKNEAETLYAKESPRRPTKLSQGVRPLKDQIKKYIEEKVKLLVEVPSVELESGLLYDKETDNNSSYLTCSNGTNNSGIRQVREICEDLQVLLNGTTDLLQKGHQLSRRKASEVMVWVLSNKDRLWSQEIPNSVPVAYGLKDYKFSSESFREACNYVLTECRKAEIKIPLLAFDGQWYSVMVRDENGKPLTALQLQKDVWTEVCKMKKKDIVLAIKDINTVSIMPGNVIHGLRITNNGNGKVTASSTDRAFTCFRSYPVTKSTSTSTKPDDSFENSTECSAAWIPEEVINIIQEKGDVELLRTLNIINQEMESRNAAIDSSHENLDSTEDISNDQPVTAGVVEAFELSDEDYDSMYDCMKVKVNTMRWTAQTIKQNMTSADMINRFSVPEIDIIADMIKEKRPMFDYKRSWRKAIKVNAVSQVVGDKSTVQIKVRKQNGSVPSLKCLSEKVVNGPKVKKASLNVGYAKYIYPDRLSDWKRNFPISTTVNVDGSSVYIDWYSVPERNNATGELLCKCIDSHHLLTNLRTKTSTTGLRNISPEAWKKVARSYETKLTPSMVEDLVDKQSNSNAQTHFSEEVERKMRRNENIREADFCKLIREWYDAEDAPALRAKDRIERWMNLRQYLLKDVDFAMFPPPTQYIKGLSLIAYEGFLTGIDTKIQLYGLCGGTYCVRTASSLAAETCVGGIQDLNFSNSVAVKAKDIPNIMSSLSEIMSYKCNPDRGFYMKTSRASVYPIVQAKQVPDNNGVVDEEDQSIIPRDHSFDLSDRRRAKPHRKSGTVNRNLDAAPLGTQPMRKQFFKCDESKIDPLKRAGFQL